MENEDNIFTFPSGMPETENLKAVADILWEGSSEADRAAISLKAKEGGYATPQEYLVEFLGDRMAENRERYGTRPQIPPEQAKDSDNS